MFNNTPYKNVRPIFGEIHIYSHFWYKFTFIANFCQKKNLTKIDHTHSWVSRGSGHLRPPHIEKLPKTVSIFKIDRVGENPL